MAQKSQSHLLISLAVITLLTIGGFLLFAGSALAATEVSATTLAEATITPSPSPLAVSEEVSNGTGSVATSTLPLAVSGEVSSQTGNGGGGGGGSSGGHRRSSGGSLAGGRRVQGQVLAAVTPCGEYLQKYIRQGWVNDPVEVVKLQLFLRNYEGFSNLTVNGLYDTATFNAVAVFQLRHSRDVLGPWGISYPTGFVFVTTRLAINNLYCARSTVTNLDLRHVYDNYSRLPSSPLGISQEFGSKEGGGVASGGLVNGTSTATSATTSWLMAGGVGILKLTSGWWLIGLLLLAIAALAYFIWKLKPDEGRNGPAEGEELLIEEPEEEAVVEQPPLDKLK